MIYVLGDFETRSLADLKLLGGRLYWEHPTTEAICFCYRLVDENGRALTEMCTWLPGDPSPFRRNVAEQPLVLVAHNASGFDRFGAVKLGWITLADPWSDTSELARCAGLPGSLDALGKLWLGLEKDHVGNAATLALSGSPVKKEIPEPVATLLREYGRELRLRRKSTEPFVWPPIPAPVRDFVVGYCESDVSVLFAGWPRLKDYGEIEPDVVRVDRAINDRGVRLDVALAYRLLEADRANQLAACKKLADEIGATPEEVAEAARSPKQFCEITGCPNAQSATVAACDHPLARVREALASIASGKLRAGLARLSPDGRLRDSHRYVGAHTWRWSHRGMQLGNMPRPAKRFEDDVKKFGDKLICAWANAVIDGHTPDQDEIDLLLRACIIADEGKSLLWEDFSSVEARFTAWLADDEDALAVFRDGVKDVYKVAAAAIFKVPYEEVTKAQRQIGKVAELACGYQGSADALMRFAKAMGIELEEELAEEIVDGWRELHAPIVQLWKDLQTGFRDAINEGYAERCGGRIKFQRADDGSAIAIFLPDGRPLIYQDAHTAGEWKSFRKLFATVAEAEAYSLTGKDGYIDRVESAARVAKGKKKPFVAYTSRWIETIKYRNSLGFFEHTYGGKITENIVQAGCRQMLARCLVMAEDAGLCPVLDVHDEIVCEVDDGELVIARHVLHDIMTSLPDWAEGFPAGADGGDGKRYRK